MPLNPSPVEAHTVGPSLRADGALACPCSSMARPLPVFPIVNAPPREGGLRGESTWAQVLVPIGAVSFASPNRRDPGRRAGRPPHSHR